MPTSIQDPEFGTIRVRRSRLSRYVRLRIQHDGQISASLPMRASLANIHQLLDRSRSSLRQTLLGLNQQRTVFTDKQQIGASHILRIQPGNTLSASVHSPEIRVSLPTLTNLDSVLAQNTIKTGVVKALRIEAKAYLPRRLHHLADLYGFNFQKVRFSSASTRWGSCSTQGTISLNIWLMQLPLEIIDYVLVHELCHTTHMNHSTEFWELVASCDPDYKAKRKILKAHHPGV